jgi:hypothetical protein
MNNHASRDDMLADSFLRDYVSQFALKPGDEKIKKKGLWKFWK